MSGNANDTGSTTVTLKINGMEVRVPQGTTLWEAARVAGVEIPTLCHSPGMRPVGVCRLCVVDVGERVLAAACVRQAAEGMEAHTDTPEIQRHQRTLLALLLADYPTMSARDDATGDDELLNLARRLGVTDIPYPEDTGENTGEDTAENIADKTAKPRDESSPVILVDHAACILCDRCIRACDEVQHNHVIGRTGKGHTARIAFDLDSPMGQSSCVSCGECMAACPTGALTDRTLQGLRLKPMAD